MVASLRLGLGFGLRFGRRLLHGCGRLEGHRTPGLRCRELGAQVVVLLGQTAELGLDLVEELIDLPHVVSLTEADGSKALVTHVLWRQRHDLTHSLIESAEDLSREQ
jgi:hypothetical protein